MNKITDKNYIRIAQDLISFKSVTDDFEENERALEYIKRYLGDFNIHEFESKGYKSVLITNTEKPYKSKLRLLLNGHIDVIEAEDDQFTPEIKGNKLYGRGAYDMKSAVAIEIEVFKELANKVDYPMGIQIVTDEEIGGFNGTGHQLKEGVNSNFTLVGESGTHFSIKNKAKGILWIKVSARGKSGHSAYPWDGKNAVSMISNLICKLEKKYNNPKKAEWKTTMNTAVIGTTNETVNKIPSEAFVKLDFRFIPKDVDILKKLRKIIPNEFGIEVITHAPAHFTDPENKDIKTLLEVCKNHEVEAELTGGHGASDMRFFTERKMDSIEFGPIGAGHHSDLEWVDIKSLDTFYNLLTEFVKNIK